MQVYLNEYNIRMEKAAYLPIATGMLRATAESHPAVKSAYDFAPFFYHVDSPETILAAYREPEVAAFSCWMWNERLCLTVAEEVKKRWPRCLIVFGGLQVPQHAQDYLTRYPFIDIAVRAEGEEAFAQILLRNLESRDFSSILNLTWRDGSALVRNEQVKHQPKDLDMYPSPYLEGIFENIMNDGRFQMQATVETNRGCPWPCAFCAWGNDGLSRKYRFHGIDRVRREIEWAAQHKVRYVFNADCVAEGTLVDTPTGKRTIESLLPGDSVYGYNADSNEFATNTILGSVFAGIKNVLRIELENGSYVDASENHRFYTDSGWKKASELRVGDWSLSRVQRPEETGEDILLSEVLLHSEGAGISHDRRETRRGGGELQTSRGDGSRETYCERSGSETNKVTQEGASRREIQEPSRLCDGRQELDEACFSDFTGAISAHPKRLGYQTAARLFMANRKKSSFSQDGVQTKARANRELETENAQILERPGMAREAFSAFRRTAKWIREIYHQVYTPPSVALSLCGGSDLVDRPMSFRWLSQPGLHSYRIRSQEGYLGSWQILASGREGGECGTGGLPLHGMGDFHRLGRHPDGCRTLEKSSDVCWSQITSIRPAGTARTYDVIEAAPTHNFFAGGLLVSNSNFGMHKRDEEIAQILVDTKTKYGYPEKFRTCFGKNADDRIYGIARKLHDAEMEKGITLALQSNTPEVLKAIRRQNIKLETYQFLQRKFNEANVPVYSELILGMPQETYDTWKTGIEGLLQAGLKNQLFVYLCQILPNTEMARPEYQKEFGIVAKRIELNEIHGAVRSDDLTTEYEDIIVGTSVMDETMWRRMVLFSWVTMVLHSMKVGFFVMLYLHKVEGRRYTDFIEFACSWDGPLWSRELREFNEQIERLLSGRGRGRIMPGYAPIYWDEEEASFLRISENADAFYAEFRLMAEAFAGCDLAEVVRYQRMRIPPIEPCSYTFKRNLPEWFDKVMTEDVALVDTPQTMTAYPKTFPDKATFAKETILWGRKSGTMLVKCETV